MITVGDVSFEGVTTVTGMGGKPVVFVDGLSCSKNNIGYHSRDN